MNLDKLTDEMVAASSDDYATSVRLMIQCLQVIQFQLPAVAVSGMDIARRYWAGGSVAKSDLELIRVECWNYLDERSASTNTEESEYCALRAVISVLYSDPPSEDIGELIDFFNQMLRGALKDENDNSFIKQVQSVIKEFVSKNNADFGGMKN